MSLYSPFFFSSVFISFYLINVKGQTFNCYPKTALGSCNNYDFLYICQVANGCICKDENKRFIIRYKEQMCIQHSDQSQPSFGSFDKEVDVEDDSDEDSSEEYDDDDESKKEKLQDFGTPIIVGIVLGTIIVCGWSFAICTLYLRKMKLRRSRSHRKRLRRRPSRSPSRRCTTENPGVSPDNVALESHYALLTPDRGQIPNIHRHSTGRSLPITSYPQACRLSMPSSLPPPHAPIALPEEEPLPAYDPPSPARYLEPELEAPPSYEEALKGCA